ncbi:heparan-alpha-glucosaminide N-acetyltransferase domain-containing protein [Mucilaginibacter sp. PAMB04274]|uniref:DUF1624 domain-containing protein n=1 Tax=Mucilaginibacter sp. PAMB04274 TaxID=3138568 RepID=UPI0031F63276
MNTSATQRIQSIDILRGLVMVIMALDHVRDFLHNDAMLHDPLDLKTTTPILFFTRWITHFCAPIFLFLSGLSAGLAGQKRSPAQTSSFLIKRGLWLVAVEVVLITLALSLNPLYNMVFFQVIWAIGISMIILGLLLRISNKIILPLGLLLIVGHDALQYLPQPKNVVSTALLNILFTARLYIIPLPGNHFLAFLYAVLPWTGIMLLGYAVSAWYVNESHQKNRRLALSSTGFLLLIAFILLRSAIGYGDPSPYVSQRNITGSVLAFLNVSKYPPSLQYTCLTLGVGFVFLAVTENSHNRLANLFKVYGKVPFFYYVPHFYLIRIVTIVVFFASGYTVKNIVSPNIPFLFRPATMGFSLGVTYLFWIGIVALLYWPCKWFAGYKQRHRGKWWASYV